MSEEGQADVPSNKEMQLALGVTYLRLATIFDTCYQDIEYLMTFSRPGLPPNTHPLYAPVRKYLLRGYLKLSENADRHEKWTEISREEFLGFKSQLTRSNLLESTTAALGVDPGRFHRWAKKDYAPPLNYQKEIVRLMGQLEQRQSLPLLEKIELLSEPPIPDKLYTARKGPCGKVVFPSEEAAKRRSRNFGARMRVYYCPECRGYHNTNQGKARKG